MHSSTRARLLRSLLCPARDRSAACGLCCAGVGAVSLHDEVAVRGADATLELRRVLAAVVGGVIDSDALPETLCAACASAAAASYSFLQLCQGYSSVLSSISQLVQTGAELPSQMHNPEAQSLFLLLEPKEMTIFVDKSDKLVSAKKALSRFKFLIRKKNKKHKSTQCPRCGKILSRKQYMKKHILFCMRRKPSKFPVKQFPCTFPGCNKICPKNSYLRMHYSRMHNEKKYPCFGCDLKFGSPELVEQHFKHEHVYRECQVCGEAFIGSKNLWNHRVIAHKELSSQKAFRKERDPEPEKVERRIICDMCGQMFPRVAPLHVHLVNKHNMPPPPGMKRTKQKRLRKPRQCDLCPYISNWHHELKVHMRKVHLGEEGAYPCDVCDKRFYKSFDLTRHSLTHTRERPERCERCDKRFVNKAALLYHTRLHTGERPYECAQCGERFLSASRRGAHVRSKHGPRPQCVICKATYADTHVLRNHILKQHTNRDGNSKGVRLTKVARKQKEKN